MDTIRNLLCHSYIIGHLIRHVILSCTANDKLIHIRHFIIRHAFFFKVEILSHKNICEDKN